MKILFRLGSWFIKEVNDPGIGRITFATHSLCKSVTRIAWLTTENPASCIACGERVPEEIQALLILYEGRV